MGRYPRDLAVLRMATKLTADVTNCTNRVARLGAHGDFPLVFLGEHVAEQALELRAVLVP